MPTNFLFAAGRSREVFKREKIIAQTNDLLKARNPIAAALHLSRKLDADTFQAILEEFEAPVPERRFPSFNVDLMLTAMNASRAQACTRELGTVLKTLDAATTEAEPPNPALQVFFDQCLAMVIERWGDVTKWIRYFLGVYHSGVYAKGEVWNFIHIITSVVPNEDDNHYKCQLVSLPSTIDVTIGLLCLEDEQDGKPLTLRTESWCMCSILALFVEFALSTTGLTSMAGRFASLDGQTRRKLFGAILGRLEDISDRLQDKANLGSGVADLYKLAVPFCAIATKGAKVTFGLRGVFQKAASVLSSLVNEAIRYQFLDGNFWTGIADFIQILTVPALQPTPNARRILDSILQEGLVVSLLNSLPYIPPLAALSGLKPVAVDLLYLVTDSRIHRNLVLGGASLALFDDLAKIPNRDPDIKSIHEAYELALSCCTFAFKGRIDTPMSMCCSFQHEDSFAPYEESTRVKTCSGCHSVFYCSEECQEEDWIAFHSQECPQAAHRPFTLPPLTELRAQDPDLTPFSERTEGDLPIVVFHGSRDAFELGPRFDVWVIQTVSSFLSSYRGGLGVQAHARATEFAKGMKQDPGSAVLVAGIFESRGIRTLILGKMKYTDSAQKDGRYMMINSIFGVSVRNKCGPSIV